MALTRVHAQFLPSGDGSFPSKAPTALPEGQARFTWEYPRPKQGAATYELTVCPPAGSCDVVSATLGVPE